jgi:hypothetical protein
VPAARMVLGHSRSAFGDSFLERLTSSSIIRPLRAMRQALAAMDSVGLPEVHKAQGVVTPGLQEADGVAFLLAHAQR